MSISAFTLKVMPYSYETDQRLVNVYSDMDAFKRTVTVIDRLRESALKILQISDP